jgi:hypothetical protein
MVTMTTTFARYKRIRTPIRCPNARLSGFNRAEAVTGDFLAWAFKYDDGERSPLFYGRVLGEALCDGVGKAYDKKNRHLAVLQIGEEMNHGFVNHISVADVAFIRTPGAFLLWALFGDMPEDVALLERLVAHGSLADRYIEKLLNAARTRIVTVPRNRDPSE